MSAFCGIIHPDGRPVPGEEIRAMSAALARSGPDRHGVWQGVGAALAHRMLCTTPESLTEELPHQAVGLVFTGDARVDNRAELLAALGCHGSEFAGTPDSAIVVMGFAAWGERLLERLVGDFAFAIWDEGRRELFLARDHFGVKPMYFVSQAGRFLFASEIKALLAHPAVPKELNHARLRSALEVTDPEADATFYRHVYRLPPASYAWVREGALRRQPYWRLDPERELPSRSTAEFAEEFLSIFTEAVRCRMRSASPVASHLSGGLDSTAVACVGRDLLRKQGRGLPLKTFSLTFGTVASCDEREYIDPVVADGGLDPEFVEADRVGPTFGLEEHFEFEEEAIFYPNNYLIDQLYGRISATGVRVCLDGFDGDTTVSHGWERFTELARSGSWGTFAQEARAAAAFNANITCESIFSSFGAPELSAMADQARWGRVISGFGQAARQVGHRPAARVFRQWIKSRLRSRVKQLLGWVRKEKVPTVSEAPSRKLQFYQPSFLRQIQSLAQDKMKNHARAPAMMVRERQCKALSSGLFSFALEHTGRLYARHGVEARHPFLDKRLVEFCIALPSSEKLLCGVPRGILRESMRGLMPEKVRTRVIKNDFSPVFVAGLLRRDRERVRRMLLDLEQHGPAEAVNFRAMREWYGSMEGARSCREEEVLAFLLTLGTAHWLRRNELLPSVNSMNCNRN
jgi:asparagine synthase (glutamine-hydrolysing)